MRRRTPEENRAYSKQLYHLRKTAGLCPHCGKRPPHQHFASCLQCKAKHRVYRWHYGTKEKNRRRLGLPRLRDLEPSHAEAHPVS
jgi:hypothetical protein